MGKRIALEKPVSAVLIAALAVLALGDLAMADSTKEQLEAEKARLQLEKDVLKLQNEIAVERATLAKVGAPPTPAEQAALATALANAQTAQYNAQTAAATAAAAVDGAELKAMFGTVPKTTLTGTVTTKTDAGKGESTLLSAVAAGATGRRIAAVVATAAKADADARAKPDGAAKADAAAKPMPIIVYTGSDKPKFQNWRLFNLRQDLLKKAFAFADTEEKKAVAAERAAFPRGAGVTTSGATEAPLLATAGVALEALSNLGTFFQSDYEFGGVTVSVDDQLLLAEVVGGLKACKATIIDPARVSPAVSDAEIINVLSDLQELDMTAPQRVEDMKAKAKNARTKAAATGTSATDKEKWENVASNYDRAAAAWQAATTAYQALLKDLGTADSTGTLWVLKVAEERALGKAVDEGALFLFLKVNSALGGYYTKKNVWTFLGTMPFYSMGGVVVTYALIDGKSGAILSSGMDRQHSGYAKVHDVPALITPGLPAAPGTAGGCPP